MNLSNLTFTPATPEPPLPCLYRNNSAENLSIDDTDRLKLKSKYKKTSISLAMNVQHLADKHGISKIGFLTLTFADHVLCPKESQRRFNNLRKHVLDTRYLSYIRVFERQKSGRIHYHLLLALPYDIRTNFDFSQSILGNYSSANPYLRSEWAFWRKSAKNYGFGRTELLPIQSSSQAIGRYVGKYIGKHFDSREPCDKGVRLVEYSRGSRMCTVRHTPLNTGSWQWRRKVESFASIVGYKSGLERPATYSELSQLCGKSWAYHSREFILSLPVPENKTDLANSLYQLQKQSVVDHFSQ